eukprot:bmy_17271T0
MGLLKGLLRARKLLLVIFVPLLLLPLPMLHPSSEAACAYVLIVTAVYWVSEAVPLGAAALVPAFLYPFFGVLRSSEGLLQRNLIDRLLLCFMCCTTLLSMWLSNTSTTAMVMPIVEAVLQELVRAEEEQLVAGTSSAEEAEPITPAQSPCPSGSGPDSTSHFLLSFATVDLDVNNSQPSLELIFVNEDTSNADFSSLMQNKNLNGVPAITNSARTANHQDKKQHPSQYPAAEVVNFGTWFLFSFPISLIMLVVSWFWMHWLFLGCNFKETCSLSKKKKTKREELSEKRIQEEYEKLGAIT